MKSILCRLLHDNLSMVFYRARVGRKEPYRVCLECGQEFAYDTDRMRVGRAIRNETATTCKAA